MRKFADWEKQLVDDFKTGVSIRDIVLSLKNTTLLEDFYENNKHKIDFKFYTPNPIKYLKRKAAAEQIIRDWMNQNEDNLDMSKQR